MTVQFWWLRRHWLRLRCRAGSAKWRSPMGQSIYRTNPLWSIYIWCIGKKLINEIWNVNMQLSCSRQCLPVSDFPGENAMILHAIGLNTALDVWLEAVLRPGSTYDSGADAARLLVSVEDLWDAAVRHAQLARDDARTDASSRQFDDLQSDVVRQWSAVDEHTAQLVHSSLTWDETTQNIAYY